MTPPAMHPAQDTPITARSTVASPPEVPSWRPWPTAFDLRSAVTYVVDLATSFVDALLSPFAAGPPRPPADPSGWALLAWVRREFFNGTPAPVENPLPHTQSLTADGHVALDHDARPVGGHLARRRHRVDQVRRVAGRERAHRLRHGGLLPAGGRLILCWPDA